MALRAVGCRWRLFASAVVQSRRGEWPTWGLAVASRRRLQGRGAFSRNRATTLPRRGRHLPLGSARAGFREMRNNPPAGSGTGGARPGERRAQVAADVVLRNCATTLPLGPARAGHDPGNDGHRSRRTWFCEIAQQPSRWVRHGRARPGEGRAQVASAVVLRNRATTLPLGPARAGHDPGKDGHRSRRSWFCEIAQQPSRWDRLLPLELAPGGCATPGKNGRRSWGRGFAKSRNDPRAKRRRQVPCSGRRRHAIQWDDPGGNRCRTPPSPSVQRPAWPDGGTRDLGDPDRSAARLLPPRLVTQASSDGNRTDVPSG